MTVIKKQLGPIVNPFTPSAVASEQAAMLISPRSTARNLSSQPVEQQTKPEVKKVQPRAPQPAATAQSAPAKPKAAEESKVQGPVPVPDGMTAADVADPQNMANNNCVSYLELVIPRFKANIDEAMAKGERPNPRIRSLWMECQKRKNVIEGACGNGQMTMEEYKQIQETQLAKDKAMTRYFMQVQQRPKAQLTLERSKVIQGELDGM